MPTTAQALYQRHRLTVDDYHRMGEAGILQEDDRVELIEGEIGDMPPIGSKHAAMVARLQRLLERAIGEQAIVWTKSYVCGSIPSMDTNKNMVFSVSVGSGS